MKVIKVGFMTESWDVKKHLKEAGNLPSGEIGALAQTDAEDLAPEREDNDPMAQARELVQQAKAESDPVKRKVIVDQIVDIMAENLKDEAEEFVASVESSIKTTRGGYGKYMQFLSSMNGINRAAFVKALRNAGAGRGLDDALMVIRGSR